MDEMQEREHSSKTDLETKIEVESREAIYDEEVEPI